MTEQTLRDLLAEASDGIHARDLATPAITEARRRGHRRRVTGGAVAAAVAVSAIAVTGGLGDRLRDTATKPDIPPAPATQPTARSVSPAVVGGWEILGIVQWFPLTNLNDPRPAANYHAATVYAVNRTPQDVSPRHGPVLEADYMNARGQFSARCSVVEVKGKLPVNKQELRSAPERQRSVSPGEKVLFACFQTIGTLPDPGDMPETGRLRIDVETARFSDW